MYAFTCVLSGFLCVVSSSSCSQGEVEQIAMMKPKGQTEHDDGMLEYLEDIIGSYRLKEPILTLARRVELLNEQRGEKVGLWTWGIFPFIYNFFINAWNTSAIYYLGNS